MPKSGEDALRQVLKHEFAAILLDVLMPGVDCFENAAAIRSLERFRRGRSSPDAQGERRSDARDPFSESS